jgi:hypothetical protein
MRKRITSERHALDKHPHLDDANALNAFNEFIVGYQLFCAGIRIEYSKTVGVQTPDWVADAEKLLLEVFTINPGGDSERRAADSMREKASKYRDIITANDYRFVLGVHGHFETAFDEYDCAQALVRSQNFPNDPADSISGVVYFAETHVERHQLPSGEAKLKQGYRFEYIPNPAACRPFDLSPWLFDRFI